MPALRFIDISGVGNSGKTAVVDLLREVDRVSAPEYWFEFDFLRVPGGLLDLRHRLVDDWSPIRSHDAVRLYIQTANAMGLDPQWWDVLGMLRSTSQRYDRRFNGAFMKRSRDLACSFVRARYRAEWPYDDLRTDVLLLAVRKVLRKLGLREPLRREVLVADGVDFDEKAKAYLTALYREIVAPDTDLVLMNNGFEPYNPVPALNMLDGRQIVVTRDPRDVYVSGLNQHNIASSDRRLLPFDNDGLNKSFLATDDVATFVKRTRVHYDHLYAGNDPRVLKLRFEDLALAYNRTVQRIFAFLEIDAARHSRPKTAFQPEVSARNVGLWRQFSSRAEIDFIARELPTLLFEPA